MKMQYETMTGKSSFVAFLFAILVFFPKSETANITAFIDKSPSPSYAVVGKNFTLEWIYTLDGTIGSVQFVTVNDDGTDTTIARGFSPGIITAQGVFQARFRAQATDTRAELTILAVQISDEGNYKLTILPTGTGSISVQVILGVIFAPNNIKITGNTSVVEGGSVNLNCSAEGKPKPNITWTRLSDGSNVTMPLINNSRHDGKNYRCTADNGVGTPVTRYVTIDVQYQPSLPSTFGNETVNDGDVLWANCTADGFPAPKTTWTRLSTNKTVSMPLTITGKQDEGFYRCTANNGIGNPATADLFVIVQFYRPINTYLSTNLTNAASLNETFYLKCSAEANPAAEYRLYKGNESVANNTAGNQNNGIYAVSVSDRVKEVVYRCIPFNSFGDGLIKTLVVIVHYPVEATDTGTNATVAEGAVKSFSCPVDGNPEPKIEWYEGSEASGKPISIEKVLTVEGVNESVCYTCVASNSLGTPVSISQCLVVDRTLTTVSSTTVLQQSTSAPSSTKPTSSGREGSAGPWAIIGGVAGGFVVLAIVVGVLTWWVHKRRKCRKDTKIDISDQERHGAYAQSGPPAANATDGAEQEIEVAAAIRTCAVVDKSKKKKLQEEVPPVYTEVDKSKKRKKKIDDKNLYDTLDEPKKEKKPGELLYADLGDFSNPGMPTVSISPQPLSAIKKADPYERTDYADITHFLKGNATLPPNDGNGDTEMKAKRPSKKKIQGKDKETPI